MDSTYWFHCAFFLASKNRISVTILIPFLNSLFVFVIKKRQGFIHLAHNDPMVDCRKRRFPYYIADSEQCDKFYRCEAGILNEELCPDGLVFDKESQSCFMIQRINCKNRPLLRKITSKNIRTLSTYLSDCDKRLQ